MEADLRNSTARLEEGARDLDRLAGEMGCSRRAASAAVRANRRDHSRFRCRTGPNLGREPRGSRRSSGRSLASNRR